MYPRFEVGSGGGAYGLRSMPVLIVDAVAVPTDVCQLGCQAGGDQTHRS
jgi:hypothetical protein